MSDEYPAVPVATAVEAAAVPAATTAGGAVPAFVFGSPPTVAQRQEEEEASEVTMAVADLVGMYGSVAEQEVRIKSIARKLQAAASAEDYQGAAQLKEALETCRAHLDQTQRAIVFESQRAQDEAKRARDEARRAQRVSRGGNPLPSRSEANASSRSKFVRS